MIYLFVFSKRAVSFTDLTVINTKAFLWGAPALQAACPHAEVCLPAANLLQRGGSNEAMQRLRGNV